MTKSRIIETVLEEVSGVKSLLLRKSDGRRVSIPLGGGSAGAQGPQGPQGEVGATGPQGSAGAAASSELTRVHFQFGRIGTDIAISLVNNEYVAFTIGIPVGSWNPGDSATPLYNIIGSLVAAVTINTSYFLLQADGAIAFIANHSFYVQQNNPAQQSNVLSVLQDNSADVSLYGASNDGINTYGAMPYAVLVTMSIQTHLA